MGAGSEDKEGRLEMLYLAEGEAGRRETGLKLLADAAVWSWI
jgi:hypothetical protein